MNWFKELFIDEAKQALDRYSGGVGGTGVGASAQSDWNQNDPTAPDYVKNRPFYTSEKTILERQAFDGFFEENGTYIGHSPIVFDFPKSGVVSVYWDGEVYTCGVYCLEEYPDGYVAMIGNTSFLDSDELLNIGDSSVPFYMGYEYLNDGSGEVFGNFGILTKTPGTSHTIGITGEEAYKLDPKYIKDMYYEEELPEKICVEAVIPEEVVCLPEATYEVGKTYTVEVNGVREEHEFVVAYIGALGMYKLGFNIMDGNQGAYVADESKILYMQSEMTYNYKPPANASVTCALQFMCPFESPVTFPATVKVLDCERVIHKLDAKYLPEYDAVVKERANDETGFAEAILLSGSYDAVIGRIKANEPPRVLFVSELETAETIIKSTFEVKVWLECIKADNTEVLVVEAARSWAMTPDGTFDVW